MTECRVELLELEAAKAAGEAVGVNAAFAELNVFRLLLRRPLVAKAVAELLTSLLFHGKLDHRLRELLIMRIGWATGSNYEWTQHWRVAQTPFEVPPEDLLALRDWQGSDRFDAADFTVLEQDPYEIDPRALADIPILGTVLGGRPYAIER